MTLCSLPGAFFLHLHYMVRAYIQIPYFFRYKTEIFSFPNNPKNLDPAFKMDLDLFDCLGRVKLVLWQNFIGLNELFVVILERGKPHLLFKASLA